MFYKAGLGLLNGLWDLVTKGSVRVPSNIMVL